MEEGRIEKSRKTQTKELFLIGWRDCDRLWKGDQPGRKLGEQSQEGGFTYTHSKHRRFYLTTSGGGRSIKM